MAPETGPHRKCINTRLMFRTWGHNVTLLTRPMRETGRPLRESVRSGLNAWVSRRMRESWQVCVTKDWTVQPSQLTALLTPLVSSGVLICDRKTTSSQAGFRQKVQQHNVMLGPFTSKYHTMLSSALDTKTASIPQNKAQNVKYPVNEYLLCNNSAKPICLFISYRDGSKYRNYPIYRLYWLYRIVSYRCRETQAWKPLCPPPCITLYNNNISL